MCRAFLRRCFLALWKLNRAAIPVSVIHAFTSEFRMKFIYYLKRYTRCHIALSHQHVFLPSTRIRKGFSMWCHTSCKIDKKKNTLDGKMITHSTISSFALLYIFLSVASQKHHPTAQLAAAA